MDQESKSLHDEEREKWEEMCFNDPIVNASQLLIEAGTPVETALKSAIYGLYCERNSLREAVMRLDGIEAVFDNCGDD